MAIEDFFTTPVTIVTPGVKADRYNEASAETVPDWDNPADEVASMGWLVQTSADEILGGRDATVTRWQLFLPADAPISAFNRVIVDAFDSPLEVDGMPNVVSTPAGPHHTEVVLRVVEG